MKGLYRRFKRALQNRDASALARLIQDHPEAHGCSARHGGVVFQIYQEAPELLEAAFRAGLSPDTGQPDPETFLQHVAAEGEIAVLRLALQHGADPERRNKAGETALGYACSYAQLEAVRCLVDAGADVNAIELHPDGFRYTALDSCSGTSEIEAFLRSKGAKTLSELERPGV
jgi:ankyrin repeat protein